MEILAIIPARGGSKGIPRKNIRLLAGVPLVVHSIKAGLNSKYVTKTVVSTEDREIADVALRYGAEVVERPAVLAQDETKTAPVMLQVIEELEKDGYSPDIVVLLQPTCPFRGADKLDEAFELFFERDCDSVFSVKNIGITHAKWRQNHDGTLTGLYDYRQRPRRQDEDCHYDMYQETGETYIIKTSVMKEVEDFIGRKPVLHVVDESVDIDTEKDFEYAQKLLLERV